MHEPTLPAAAAADVVMYLELPRHSSDVSAPQLFDLVRLARQESPLMMPWFHEICTSQLCSR